MARVLVAGGTGFIGSQIVRRLIARGHRVAVLTRNPNRRPPLPGVELRAGDVTDPNSLRQAMIDVDVLVSSVQFPGHPVENPRKGYTYLKVDGQGTVNQVEAAKAAGVRRLVYLGGAGTRPGQTAPWFRAKLMAETAIKESGIPYTILRPSWIYGPEDHSLNRFAGFARLLPFVPVIGNGRGRVQPVLVDDVAEAVALSLELPHTGGRVYEIGGPENLTMDEIIRTMLRVMNKRRPLFHQPAWLMKLAAAPLTLLPTPPLSPAAIDFILMEEPVDLKPLLADFPLRLTPLAEGLAYLRPTRESGAEADKA